MRLDLNKVVAQGKEISPLKCTISVDAIAESKVENLSDHLYNYKGRVPIPSCGWLMTRSVGSVVVCPSRLELKQGMATFLYKLRSYQKETHKIPKFSTTI